jgi:hypothetical protein
MAANQDSLQLFRIKAAVNSTERLMNQCSEDEVTYDELMRRSAEAIERTKRVLRDAPERLPMRDSV